MAKMQSVDRKASFLLVVDVNAYHEKWLGSSTTNGHGWAAHDFASLSGYGVYTHRRSLMKGCFAWCLQIFLILWGFGLARLLEPQIIVPFL